MIPDNTNLRAQAYIEIKDKIMNLTYAPGQKVSLQTIVEDISLGKTPIHEALLQLNQDGLIEMIPQSGTYISKIDLGLAHESRFTRELLEVEIMQEAAVKITPSDKQNLKKIIYNQQQAISQGNRNVLLALDDSFHQYFYTMTGHEQMWQWLQLYGTHLSRFRKLRFDVANLNVDFLLNQHESLLQAVFDHELATIRFRELTHIRLMLNEEDAVRTQFPDYFI